MFGAPAGNDIGASYFPNAATPAGTLQGSATGGAWGVFRWDGVSIADIPAPAETIAIAEADERIPAFGANVVRTPLYWYGRYVTHQFASGAATSSSMKADCFVAVRHNDGANFAFADGHVKWFGRGNVAGVGTTGCQPRPNLTGPNQRINGLAYYYYFRTCPPGFLNCGK